MSTRTTDEKLTAFVVDDEHEIADALADLLSLNGFLGVPFHSPIAALDALELITPDFLVTDFAMPVINGLTLAALVLTKNPNCKVLVLSGNLAAMDAHPDRYRYPVLQKPASFLELVSALHRCEK